MTIETRELLEMDLAADAADWRPTPHGNFLAEVLAEQNLVEGRSVLELGAGVGNHTIVMLRQGARRVVATEITEGLLETTRRNVRRNVEDDSACEYRVADWLDTPGTFDLVVTNPPFARSGKQNRRYFIDSLILDAHKRLEPGGEVLFVQSSMADVAKSERRLWENGFDVERLAERKGPFRDYYFEDETFMEEIRGVPNGYEILDDTYIETLYVLRGRLRPFSPPAGAHIVTEDSQD